MKQKKHNLGHAKNTSNNEEDENEDEALEKALHESADPFPYLYDSRLESCKKTP